MWVSFPLLISFKTAISHSPCSLPGGVHKFFSHSISPETWVPDSSFISLCLRLRWAPTDPGTTTFLAPKPPHQAFLPKSLVHLSSATHPLSPDFLKEGSRLSLGRCCIFAPFLPVKSAHNTFSRSLFLHLGFFSPEAKWTADFIIITATLPRFQLASAA